MNNRIDWNSLERARRLEKQARLDDEPLLPVLYPSMISIGLIVGPIVVVTSLDRPEDWIVASLYIATAEVVGLIGWCVGILACGNFLVNKRYPMGWGMLGMIPVIGVVLSWMLPYYRTRAIVRSYGFEVLPPRDDQSHQNDPT
jgi:hypothetical protein